MSPVIISDNSGRSRRARPQGVRGLAWLALSAVVFVLDQWTKAIAIAKLELHQPVPFVDGFWNWMLARNYGVAFSLFDNQAGWQRYGLSAFALLVATVFVVWLTRVPARDRMTSVALALIVGGAIGNVTDRLRFGYVVDFIDWYAGSYHWPAFNIADSAVVCGAVLLVLTGWLDSRRARR